MLTIVCRTIVATLIPSLPPVRTRTQQAVLDQFGHCVSRVRKARGISQEELATRASVHRTYIGMIERGEKNVTILTMFRIAHALQVKPSTLLEGFSSE